MFTLPVVFPFRSPPIYRPHIGGSEDGTLVFVCPNLGRDVFTGLEIMSFEGLPEVLADITCQECGATHNLFEVQARLVYVPRPLNETAAVAS